jgi:type IV pilus assembly protein PilX
MSIAIPNPVPARQRGAALIVGLLLLLVLTLLAVSGMNSASVEFVMAGNEQYQKNAFQAAETGIEQAFNGQVFIPRQDPAPVTNVAMPNAAGDVLGYTVATDVPDPVPLCEPGYSNDFGCFFFTVRATGRSIRSSVTAHTQGFSFVVKTSDADSPQCGGTAATLSAPGGAGGC